MAPAGGRQSCAVACGHYALSKEPQMRDQHELPNNPVCAFYPKLAGEDDIHQVVIVFQGLPGYVSAAFHVLTRHYAGNLSKN